jgi:hypothetical protein
LLAPEVTAAGRSGHGFMFQLARDDETVSRLAPEPIPAGANGHVTFEKNQQFRGCVPVGRIDRAGRLDDERRIPAVSLDRHADRLNMLRVEHFWIVCGLRHHVLIRTLVTGPLSHTALFLAQLSPVLIFSTGDLFREALEFNKPWLTAILPADRVWSVINYSVLD